MDDLRIILAVVGAVLFLPLTWVWSVARSAKSCAHDARTDVEKQGVEVAGLGGRMDELHATVEKGFDRVHARLDKMINGS